ncbi:hypothetical protein OESDEN_19776 [Oesophagostomum dentatum]|uniref:Uncharacterized protein n=1 Tax=Oesophagostomum dentatum TaxID=61180 RepID=A0A0B1S5B6_OESDE|nr:hypothetical protein OESDEN_19776 [Oesophagostomum dentatum]
MQGLQAHQTLVSALTSPGKERTNAFGRMGFTSGQQLAFSFQEIIEDNQISTTSVVRTLSRPGVLNVMFKKNAPIVPTLLIFSIMKLYLIEQFNAGAQMGQLLQLIAGKNVFCALVPVKNRVSNGLV